MPTEERPYAAVCLSGHIIAWFVYGFQVPAYCSACGERVISECQNILCAAPLPASAGVREGVPYFPYCGSCGNAYPWHDRAVAESLRTLSEEAEVEEWNAAVKERAAEVIGDIGKDRISGSTLLTATRWLEQRGGEGAKEIIIETAKSIGSEALKSYLRSKGVLPPL